MNSNENNEPRINAAKAQQNGIEQTSVFGPSAGQQQPSFDQGAGQAFGTSAAYAAHGQWTASGPADEGCTAAAARSSNDAAAAQPKTKKAAYRTDLRSFAGMRHVRRRRGRRAFQRGRKLASRKRTNGHAATRWSGRRPQWSEWRGGRIGTHGKRAG